MPASGFETLALRETPGGTEVPIRVSAKAKRSGIRGLWRTALKVQVAAQPQEGKANEELCAFLARFFGISRRSIRIRAGEKSKDKVVILKGIGGEKIRSLLAELHRETSERADKTPADRT